jgi:catechol 2,3-dioxygenase-like lactoylglutathione lyase family enzyme
MVTTGLTLRLTSLAPQFLVDDLERAMAYYRDVLGFRFGEPWGGFYAQCVANGAKILKPLAATAWGTKDFYVEDPDGYIISFGGTAVEPDAGRTKDR